MGRLGALLAAVALLATGCAGAGPGIDDPQPATPQAKFVERAHVVAPPTKHLTDADLVTAGHRICRMAPKYLSRPGDARFMAHAASQAKGGVRLTYTQSRHYFQAAAILCPGKMSKAARWLRIP